jgi:DNA gyrase/topoisomerase IV subunit A
MKLKSITKRKYETPIPVYDMTVHSNSNFFANGILIHNCGYNHGEAGAASAGQLMAADWSNNICLIEGRGSFGTRLVQEAAAARYTYTRLHRNFARYIRDIELSPEHSDPEHEPPAFYLPVIPLVLANGVKGIATGFATSILPRCPQSLAKACEQYIRNGRIKDRPTIKFPQFSGSVTYNEEENRYYCLGVYEKPSKTVLRITEVPYGFDRESYVKVLDDLEEKSEIVGYDDLCDKDGFCFEVKLKQSTSATWGGDRIIQKFKLSKPYTENLTVIDMAGKLREYTDERDLIRDFCDYRLSILQKRIDLRKSELSELCRWLSVKMQFIQAVLDNQIEFKNQKKDRVAKQIVELTDASTDDVDRLLRLNMLSLTDEMVRQLQQEIDTAKKDLKYWTEDTSPSDQFLLDLKDL